MNPYFLFPFLFELIYDWRRITNGKSDLHWGWRIPMVLLCSVDFGYPIMGLHIGKLLLCVVPYCFFDIALNILRKKKWDHLGAKFWDRNLVRINPWFLLVIRFVAACILLYVAFKVG